ncbi:hypothetical protein KY315_03925, partial [Candidatus Woesearchaeota archaeon]|nr:hypothetical protein [Candidatus Woesearchaeota archaeon]
LKQQERKSKAKKEPAKKAPAKPKNKKTEKSKSTEIDRKIKQMQKEREKLKKEREKNKEQAKKDREKLKKQRKKDKESKRREKEREKTRKEREKLKAERKKVKEQAKKDTKKKPAEKPKATVESVKEKLQQKKETQAPDMSKTERIESDKLHLDTGETTTEKQKRVEKSMAPSGTGTGGTEDQFLEQMGDREVSNPNPTADKRTIKIKSLKTTDYPTYKKLYEQWRGPKETVTEDTEEPTKAPEKEVAAPKEEPKAEEPSKHSDVKEKLQDKRTDVAITNKSQENYALTLDQIKNNADKVNGSIDMLMDPPKPSAANIEESKQNVDTLNDTLGKIKINGKVNDVSVGPVFSTYHVKFDINDLSKLRKRDTADKLTLALGKPVRVRINKTRGTADIELQNDKRSMVTFKELVTDDDFVNQAASPKSMPVMLGKDKTGKVSTLDLSDPRSPHALIVGQTGAGKSVLLQQAIASVMYGKKPSEAQLILLDPKGGAEFGRYDGSEYLAQPVAKTGKDSVMAVRDAWKDMEGRYKKFDKAGVSNVNSFNKFVTKDPAEMTDEEKEIFENMSEEERKPLPKTVIVADELSDLMSNDNIRSAMIKYTTALGRKARAAGIHMVFATQRPTKAVIPSEIQANLPAKVIMKVDSRGAADYVDTPGAQNLLGKGDMLVKGIGEDQRIQSGFIDEPEADKVAEEFDGVGKVRKTPPKADEIVDEPESPSEEPGEQHYDSVPDAPGALKTFRQEMQGVRDKLQLQRENISKLLEQEEKRTERLLDLGEETEMKEQELEKQREQAEGVDEVLERERRKELEKQKKKNKEIDEALEREEAELEGRPIEEKTEDKKEPEDKDEPKEEKVEEEKTEEKQPEPKQKEPEDVEPEIPEEVKSPEERLQTQLPEESDEEYKARVGDEIEKMIDEVQGQAKLTPKLKVPKVKEEEEKKEKKALTQTFRELLSRKRKA